MRIWHQSFTVLEDVPHYRDALARHMTRVASPGTVIDFHGMAPGTYPSDYPGVHIGFNYLSGLHREQFVQAAQQAELEGYDAFVIGTIPDTGFEEARSIVDIPVVAFGNASVGYASQFGNCVGITHFIPQLSDQIKRNMRNYGFGDLVGPIVQVDAAFHDIMAAYAEPAGLIGAFEQAARTAIAAGANVIVPGEGPLNVFLADQGITRVDEVPVIDSLGALVQLAEVRAASHQRVGLRPSRNGFYFAQPPAEAIFATRDFYRDRPDSART
jgi:allantoin racemase